MRTRSGGPSASVAIASLGRPSSPKHDALDLHRLARVHAVGLRVFEQQLVELLALDLVGVAELRDRSRVEAEGVEVDVVDRGIRRRA
jgi:hypothetical protein